MRSALVLAGGAGARMGGGKPLRPFRGRPLVAWTLEALAPLVDETLVAVGPAPDAALLAALPAGVRAVRDPGRGPLPALHAGARAAGGDVLLVAPCDAPLLDAGTFRALLAAAEGREGAVAVVDGVENFLVAAYRRAALLRCGAEGAPRRALAGLDLARVPVDARVARDADTPEALAEMERGA